MPCLLCVSQKCTMHLARGTACRWRMATAGLVARAAAAMSLASNPMRTVTVSSTALWRARGSNRLLSNPLLPGAKNAAGAGQMNSRRGAVVRAETPTGTRDVTTATAAETPTGPGTGNGSQLPRMAPPSSDSVRHAHSSRTGPLWGSVAAFLGWTEERARKLIEFGGVYYKPGNAPATAKPKREIDPDREVEVGEYFRVYSVPKRYPACEDVDWESKIMYESGGVMLVNKPAGVPAHATVDNYVENMLAGLREVRPGVELFLPHRLDIDTSGLVIVVKDSETLSCINDLIRAPGLSLQTVADSERARRARERALRRARKAQNKALRQHMATTALPEDGGGGVLLGAEAAAESSSSRGGEDGGGGAIHKRYRALVEILPGKSPLKASDTPLTHFQKVSRRAPKEFRRNRPQPDGSSVTDSEEARSKEGGDVEEESWIECRLRVLSASEVRFSSSGAFQGLSQAKRRRGAVGAEEGGQAGSAEAGLVSERMLQEVEVELLTGRTHQIRGQLAAEGCPIYGDLLYGPAMKRGTLTGTESKASVAATSRKARTPSTPSTAEPTGGRFVLRRAKPSLSPASGEDWDNTSENRKPGTKANAREAIGTGSEGDDSLFSSLEEKEGSRLGSDPGALARQLQSGFVDSPKMALQACHISLEIEGLSGGTERHSFTLGRDTCWWATQ
ncbi:unnamed protein product [Scytosiphon promiscuus]